MLKGKNSDFKTLGVGISAINKFQEIEGLPSLFEKWE